jgi:phosphomannomutase
VIDLGVVPSGLLYFMIKAFDAKGGLYVTRSHVEVGTNGAKPVVDGITLFGEMLQAMKAPILANQYKKAQARGTLTKSSEVIAQAEKAYHDFLVEEFKGLKAILYKMPMKVGVNFNGGSTAADPEVKELFQEILGDHLVSILRDESDPWGKNGGLADSSRDDAKALAHPKADIIEYSRQHPDEVIFNFDLDADRVSIVFNGKLYLGDDMFLPVVEYQLTMAPDKEYYKEMFIDSRMKATLTDAIRHFGGIVKKHPKGHSKVKASMDVALEAMAKKENMTVDQFLKAHSKFRMLQPEFSLHMFSSNKYGASIDDAVRFSLIWLEIFSAIKEKYSQPNWTLPQYIQYLEDQGITKPVSQVKEQRTPIKDAAKVPVMKRMTQKVQGYFGRHPELKFEFYPRWQDFNGSSADYVFVDVDGVYDLTTPMGHIFWGWSNTSPKIAFGVQADTAEKTRRLLEITMSLLAQSRQEIADEMGVTLESISPIETSASQRLLNIKPEDLPTFEIKLQNKYPGDKLFEALTSSSAIGKVQSSSAISQKLDSDMLNKGFIADDEGYYSPTTSSSSSSAAVPFQGDLDIGLLAKNMDSKIRVRFAHLFEDTIVLTSKFYTMPVPSITLDEGQRVKFDLMNGSSINIVRR